MTRKDFELIASVLKNFELQGNGRPIDDRDIIAYDIADAIELEHPRFDRYRFLVACGVYGN